MPVAAELTDPVAPVGYSWVWTALAVLLVLAVAGYYAAVARWAAAGELPAGAPPEDRVGKARKEVEGKLAALERTVVAGRVTPRRGCQDVSALLRGFVHDVGAVPARAMTLADLREEGDPRLADAVAELYPPEFAPDEVTLDEFRAALRRARELVAAWP